MNIPTVVYADMAAWIAAGRPVGGVFPLPRGDRDAEMWPARYKDVEQTYYVALPTGQLWCPWQKAFNTEQGYHGEGWNVNGSPECMTITPSIQVAGWHGYVTNGELVAA